LPQQGQMFIVCHGLPLRLDFGYRRVLPQLHAGRQRS
jgi:hypothetical protein